MLKHLVEEYRDESIEDICELYIAGDSKMNKHIESTHASAYSVVGNSNENIILGEGKRIFDIYFSAITPINYNNILINIEPQNQYYPGYTIDTRMVYYMCRMISSQYGTEFINSDYDDIKKVYSIWICTNPSKSDKNSISSYRMSRKLHLGMQKDKVNAYDKMVGIKICLGDENAPNYTGIIKLLHILLVSKIKPTEKKRILMEEFGFPQDVFGEEMEEMCNYSEGIYNDGIEAGIQLGEKRLINLIDKLTKESGIEEIDAVINDEDYREKMYRKFNIS